MKHFNELIKEHVDFHFVLVLVAIFGTAGFLSLQFTDANTEFEIMGASMYSVVRTQGGDEKENISINHELDELQDSLDELTF